MDDYFGLLNQALADRNNLWMFYTIIVTTALGTAFTDSYKKLGTFPRVILTICVGAVLWFNFYAVVINSIYVNEIVSIIRRTSEDPEIIMLFSNELFYNQEEQLIGAIVYVFTPINFSVFFAMWWDAFMALKIWAKKKFSKVQNDEYFFDTKY